MQEIIEGSTRQRIYGGGFSQEDRLELVKLLVKAGYTARIGKERPKGKTSGAYVYFVEYWHES